MQVKRLACVLPLLAALPARAGLAPESQEASVLFHYFADVEDVHVRSHYAFYGLDLGGRHLSLEFNHERVSIPAVQAPAGSQEATDAITAASRPIANAGDAFRDFVKFRNAMQADLDLGPGKLGFYRSQEVDYNASMVSGSLQHDLDQAQLNLSVGAGYGWDRVEPVSDADTGGAEESKTILHLNVVATRILDPRTVLRVGGELNRLAGLQHNPYRNVYAGGQRLPEQHPDERHRQDLFLKLNRYLGERSSLGLDYRYYTDDWRLHSHTAGLKLNQYLGPDLVFRYRYRFYRQSGAWFWADEYADAEGIDGYRSGDYRLGPFDAHLFGTRVEWALSALSTRLRLLQSCRLRLGYERYFNSNEFAANVFETGLSLEF